MSTLFYVCPICGNLVVKIEDGGPAPHCCGQEMEELVPGTVEASKEKHIPVLERIDKCTVRVKVGSEAHPMTLQHHIVFIWLETARGGQLKYLSQDGEVQDEAMVEMCCTDPIVAVYSYCNIHGLWKYSVL